MSVICSLGMYAEDVSSRTISTNGKTSTWNFTAVTSKTLSDNSTPSTTDQEIVYTGNKNSFHANASYLSSNGGTVYIPVPSGSAGTISMEVAGDGSDSRYYKLSDSKKLWSKYNETATEDGKKGPRSFAFTSDDITTYNSKTYLKLVATGGEMKVNSFKVELTTGAYETTGEKSNPSWNVSDISVVNGGSVETSLNTNYDGTIQAQSTNTNIATVSIDGKKLTVTGVALGSTTITITGSETDNFQSLSKTINVTVTRPLEAITSNTTWTFDGEDWPASTTGSQIINNLELGSGLAIDANIKKIDGLSFTKRIKLGGTGSTSSNYVKFKVSGPCTIVAYGMSSKSGESRTIGIKVGDADVADLIINDGNAIGKGVYSYSSTATSDIYIYSKNSGNNIYGISVIYPETKTLGANGYSTYCSDYAFTASGADVYSATCEGTTVTLVPVTGAVAAGEGVIFKGEAGANVTISPATETASRISVNALIGVNSSTTAFETGTNYVLSSKGTETAFVVMASGKTVADMVGKSYLNIQDSEAKSVIYIADNATAINAVETEANDNAPIYNLAGQRVNANASGIVIKNGRKFINK